MVSKVELRKLNKEKLVGLVYDLLIKIDKLTAEVLELREEVKMLKTPKNSGNSSLPPLCVFYARPPGICHQISQVCVLKRSTLLYAGNFPEGLP